MLHRKLIFQLQLWQKDGARRPLVLYGARQVGKSYTVTQFAQQNYRRQLVVNFENDQSIHQAFVNTLRPRDILEWLANYYHQKIDEHTLIFFDEIQKCQRALTSLKYFAEENERGAHHQIIAAGSLLGVSFGPLTQQTASFPVGKVDQITVYPLDFEEFLWARGEQMLAQQIRVAFNTNQPLPQTWHERAEKYYKMYLVVGGMPEVVQTFLDGRDYRRVQERIVNQYREDMIKYITAAPDKQKVIRLYESVVSQLGEIKNQRRFSFTQIEANGSAKKYRYSVEWLRQAHLVIQCLPVKQGRAPLQWAQTEGARKLYLSDTGLLCWWLKIGFDNLVSYDSQFLGMLTENYVAVALQSHINSLFDSLHFWQTDSPDGKAEVDFIVSTSVGNVPIEVKTFANTKAKSLDVFIKKYHPALAYRISSKQFGYNEQKHLKSLPHYAVFCIEDIW